VFNSGRRTAVPRGVIDVGDGNGGVVDVEDEDEVDAEE
jgi:hypothetical protein